MKITKYSEYKQALSHIQDCELPLEGRLMQMREKESQYINDVFIPLTKLDMFLCILLWISFGCSLLYATFFNFESFKSSIGAAISLPLAFLVVPMISFLFIDILIKNIFFGKKSKGYTYQGNKGYDSVAGCLVINILGKFLPKIIRKELGNSFVKLKNQPDENVSFKLGERYSLESHSSNMYCVFISSKHSFFIEGTSLMEYDTFLEYQGVCRKLGKLKQNDRDNIKWCFYNNVR